MNNNTKRRVSLTLDPFFHIQNLNPTPVKVGKFLEYEFDVSKHSTKTHVKNSLLFIFGKSAVKVNTSVSKERKYIPVKTNFLSKRKGKSLVKGYRFKSFSSKKALVRFADELPLSNFLVRFAELKELKDNLNETNTTEE